MKNNKIESVYENRLKEAVIASSESDTWEHAVKEWKICECTEDNTALETCICANCL